MQCTIIGKFAYLIWWDQINRKLPIFKKCLTQILENYMILKCFKLGCNMLV